MKLERLGLATRTLNALKKKKIYTTRDFVQFLPKKYHHYKEPKNIWECEPGDYEAVIGQQDYVQKKQMNGKFKNYLSFRFSPVTDEGTAFFVRMFNNVFKMGEYAANTGKTMVVCGRVKHDDYGWSVDDISYMIPLDEYAPHTHPVYPSISGVSDEMMQKIRKQLLTMQSELLEPDIYEESGMMDYTGALNALHYPAPSSADKIEKAHERLLYNDLLYFSLSLKQNEAEAPTTTEKSYTKWDKTLRFIESLPFQLTSGEGSQKEVLNSIFMNAKKGKRNNILLQGDVGCGKTIVAAALMMYSAENNYQSVLMAPREVLARQHYEEIKGYADANHITCAFLHSGLKAAERKSILKEIASGNISFVIGTHSCISKDVKYKNLGAVITDEEHLFGVNQKAALIQKAMDGVHSLSMSATPIPRTMASVIYGQQKEIRIITKKPAGRLPIVTKNFFARESVFPLLEEEIGKGHQGYVVCPAIEDNDNTDIVSIELVESMYREHFEPKGIKIGIVNGKMKKEDVAKTVSDFVENKIQILISTTVIEVGVNVPNATVMVVEQAERFGLASLHQLRGRVGRSTHQSYCALICADPFNERVLAMCKTSDGFKIAEEDLKQRGSGDLIGTSQSGINKYVEEMLENPELFLEASRAADKCIENNYGRFLMAEYEDHLEEEEKEKQKKSA